MNDFLGRFQFSVLFKLLVKKIISFFFFSTEFLMCFILFVNPFAIENAAKSLDATTATVFHFF